MAYTTIDDPSAYFHTQLYSGDGGGSNAITNDANAGDFKPDWLWIKERTSDSSNTLVDSTRGAGNILLSDSTNAEASAPAVSSLNTDGFTLGSDGKTNEVSQTYVAWQWKANGGTTTTNDASATSIGDTDSVYQVNSTAKFSIVTWTGSGSGTVSIAHGLGSTPKFIIIKQRDGANSWLVYHHKNTVVDDPHDTFLKLHLTNASSADANNYFMADTAPTSTVATFGSGTEANESGTYIGYFFDEIQGYSKFGGYTGNANANGAFVYTGFKPAWLLIKRTDSSGNWVLIDSKRDAFNQAGLDLNSDSSAAENSSTSYYGVDLLSNGFKLRNGNPETNGSGTTNVYMAFAEHPFVSSEGVPTTAR